MAVTVGVNVSATVAYVALVENGVVLAREPYSFTPGEMLGSASGLVKFEEVVARQLAVWEACQVVVLEPETSYKGTYANVVDRIGIETVFLLAAHRSGIESYRLSRQKTRSILALGRGGTFEAIAADRVDPVGPYWRKMRDCAALAALAGERG
ncbi:hypothetical protein [Mycolicibacterium iranicum]|uniref:Uncharacterized protein n=1 Tax=Mycolicibacterium iranicum TaxID=912594 RepID=A0ABT4HL07_MYCIR|nr:hypothetical protein [Mycolicibacterium iranicum]MCZ0730903.1 hypothetical protein [Mycolicibacterium iranicum]